ncbi:FKBP-type peptidyl-prolyl cis-trans isomerase [Hymenobacter caeli]|uniref:Peptidyl-prolyl cis-trans isomerase n=1 Tax=Hymenobacter caeli TaxID=2735894 RepID=A0ABX2FTT9_9BACT|nr:FKBP-type peptidyl-prolyl cis-trans isomerase [Hymenobacter caeli]NRT20610.1 FKBP-type peptidyl-prolyl cis-trans isomerase [Hymenobacter caeli]
MKTFLARFRLQLGLLSLLLLCATPALWSCSTAIDTSANDAALKAAQEHQAKYQAIDDTILQGYLKRHSYTAANYQRTASGLYLVTLTAGTGTQVAPGKQISVKYTGKFVSAATENKVFDTSDNAPSKSFDYTVGAVSLIQGWSEGVALMRQGDRKLLLIPSYLAYGPSGQGPIPPDTPILFDMQIVTVSP